VQASNINTDIAIINEGLEENDLIALSDPFMEKEEVMKKNVNGNNKIK
jgi:hypothetical protein